VCGGVQGEGDGESH
jgi:hypothetical protein